MSLAEALLEEIMALPYQDPEGASSPGAEAGESGRSNFDNADDYHGYTESMGTVVDVAGTSYGTTFARFSRSVSATYSTLTVAPLGDPVDGLSVTVTVQDERGVQWTTSRFIPEPAS